MNLPQLRGAMTPAEFKRKWSRFIGKKKAVAVREKRADEML
jgi:hypothetical protein